MVGHALFGGNGALRQGYEGIWENLHLLRNYGSPDGTEIVTVLLGEVTGQPGRVGMSGNGRKLQR